MPASAELKCVAVGFARADTQGMVQCRDENLSVADLPGPRPSRNGLNGAVNLLGRYGNFDAKHSRWESYPALPRYGIQYVALRNRVALLSESYVYATYNDRIRASRAFVEGCLEHAAAHGEAIAKLLAAADKPREKIALRIKTVSLGKPVAVKGYVEEERDGVDQIPLVDPVEVSCELT